MKLYKLHEAKTLSEMTGGLDVPMNASPTQGMPNQEVGDLKKKLDELDMNQQKMGAAMTSPSANPAVAQARGMQNQAAARNAAMPTPIQAPTSATAAAAINPAPTPSPSDGVNKEPHDANGPRMPTSTF